MFSSKEQAPAPEISEDLQYVMEHRDIIGIARDIDAGFQEAIEKNIDPQQVIDAARKRVYMMRSANLREQLVTERIATHEEEIVAGLRQRILAKEGDEIDAEASGRLRDPANCERIEDTVRQQLRSEAEARAAARVTELMEAHLSAEADRAIRIKEFEATERFRGIFNPLSETLTTDLRPGDKLVISIRTSNQVSHTGTIQFTWLKPTSDEPGGWIYAGYTDGQGATLNAKFRQVGPQLSKDFYTVPGSYKPDFNEGTQAYVPELITGRDFAAKIPKQKSNTTFSSWMSDFYSSASSKDNAQVTDCQILLGEPAVPPLQVFLKQL